jgi:mono/diheme cytochrome c family protein
MLQYQHGSKARWYMRVALATVGLALVGPVWTVDAQPVPNTAAAGKQLAQQYCVSCHIITSSGTGGWTDAPRFDAIANRLSAEQISAFVQKPHMNMLNDQRPKAEADAIATYILSLRKH